MKKLFLPVILIALLFGACTNQSKSPPNIVFIIADDVSWNDLGCYGNEDVQTPFINRLAREGLKFNNVYLTASSCSPSRTSIISGRYPHNTGSAELHTPLPGHLALFPEELKKAGYYTAASGKWHMGDAAKRAFDTLALENIGQGGEDQWLTVLKKRPKDKPFFLWLASLDAHRDWSADTLPEPHDPGTLSIPDNLASHPATKQDLASYYNEIARFDHFVGQVHREIIRQGEAPNTLIIVCADNGRPFPGAKTRVNDAGMKTPFIAWWPQGIEDHGSEVDALVSIIDLAPTLTSLAGLVPHKDYQGKSFAPLFRESDSTFRNVLFAEHNWHDYEAYERMCRTQDYLYIYNGRPNLANQGPADAVSSPSMKDLKKLAAENRLTAIQAEALMRPRPEEELYYCMDDPEQMINLAADSAFREVLLEMRALLAEWQKETGDTQPTELTRDWYLRDAETYIETEQHGIRGEMPGSALRADTITGVALF